MPSFSPGTSPSFRLGMPRSFQQPFTPGFSTSDGADITGYIDRIGRVQGTGSQIVDYKTGRKGPDAAHPDQNLQLGMYYLAVNRAEELAPYRPVRAVARLRNGSACAPVFSCAPRRNGAP